MLFERTKHVSSVSRKTRPSRHPLITPELSRTRQGSRCPAKSPDLCPKKGEYLGPSRKYRWLMWLFPIAGLLSLIWFLIRVLPKPSRATYPCQRLAAPLASSFVVWLVGLIGSTLAYRKAMRFVRQSRYVLAGICVAVGVMAVWWSVNATGQAPAQAAFTPTDPPNSPMGIAKGIHPGRVVWFRDPTATSWDGSTGDWWDDDNTDQDVVDYMVSRTIQTLTAAPNDVDAWDALFRHFNQTKGFGDIDYQAGEKITIKINMNQNRSLAWSQGQGMPSPHMVYSLLAQLIYKAAVPGDAITIYDASRYIGDPIFDKVRGNPDPNFQSVRFVADRTYNGRIAATHDTGNPLYTKAGTAYLPQCVTDAKYLINMALLRPHSLYGVTLCAKNHFGSVYFGSWTPSPLHNYGLRGNPMGSYNCLVNLNGHRHLSGKAMLYMIDGLYPARNQENNVIKWSSFGDDWFSGMLASQDPVAIDSVALDFLRNEPRCTDVTGNPDNYLHEMAQADNPASGTFYDPEDDGTRLESLGVHEHWNNPVDRQYSRNLGTGNGIELVTPSLTTPDGPVENMAKGTRYDYIRHAISDADPCDEIVASPWIYRESIYFAGKNLTVRSIDPSAPAAVAATVIKSSGDAVTFSGGEDTSCVLAGFTIAGGGKKGDGGGILCEGDDSRPTIRNCVIAGSAGIGINCDQSSPTITNCIVAGNGDIGIKVRGRTATTVTNCTIVKNAADGVNAYRGLLTIVNSIIWANADSEIYGSLATTYTNVEGGYTGLGNIDKDPCFVLPGLWVDANDPNIIVEPNDPNAVWIDGDYHLKSEGWRWDTQRKVWTWDDVTSRCIDAGNPGSPLGDELLSIPDDPNNIWGQNLRINMGAYGGTAEASMPPYDWAILGDLTNDGKGDSNDLAAFVNYWLDSGGCIPSDLDRNQSVDLPDFALLAQDWLRQTTWHE